MIKELSHLPYEVALTRKAIVAFYNIKKEKYLKIGTYKLHLYGKPVIYNSNVKEILEKYPAKYNVLFNKICLLNKNSTKEKTFQADYAMVLAGGEYKLFDISNKVVYTRMSENKRNTIVLGQKLFKDYFNTTYISEDSNGIFEKYIDYIPIANLQYSSRILLLENIIHSYTEYEKNNKGKGLISKQICFQQINSLQMKSLSEITNIILRYVSEDIQIPMLNQHGDMHFGNLLYDGQTTYLIDFEMFREELFFYDIMNCCYVEIVDNNNYDLIEWYFSDSTNSNALLDMLFSEMGISFCQQKKCDYFALFILRRLYADILRANNRLSKNKAKKYSEYIIKKNKIIIKYLEGI